MQIKEIMTKNPACCAPDSTLQEVAQLMVKHDCGLIPVVDSQLSMKPIGTITDRDIAIRTAAVGKNPVKMKASEIMTTDIVTITPETSVQQCAEVMKREDIRRVLVVDKTGRCVGIVAQADLAQHVKSPHLISEVVNEISQSAPSPQHAQSQGKGKNKSFSLKEKILDFNTVLPLLAGVGAGAALKYYLYPNEKSENQGGVKHRISLPTKQKPDEFDKMASELKHTTPAVNADKRDAITGNVTPLNKDDSSEQSTEIGRSATPKF
jgi:CBS domain-containing protein